MSAETLINSALLASAPVTLIVGSGLIARIYPDFLTQLISLPAIVTQRANTQYINTIHTGEVQASNITMDTWCLAATRVAAESLADLVENALVIGGFRLVDRRPEFNEETLTYAAVVAGSIWL